MLRLSYRRGEIPLDSKGVDPTACILEIPCYSRLETAWPVTHRPSRNSRNALENGREMTGKMESESMGDLLVQVVSRMNSS